MCIDPSARISAHIARRAALAMLGSSLVAGLSACAVPDTAGHMLPADDPSPAAQASWDSPAAATPSPTSSKRIQSTFIPDYRLPPIQNGLAPVITRIQTQHPVVFLTIDDGITKTPQMLELMAESDLPATLFLTRSFVQDNPAFFKTLHTQGSLVENHTISHNINMIREMSYNQQLAEITGMQTYTEQQFGRRPTLFRPPGGAYSNIMRKAVADAGLKAIVTWEAKANAGHMDYQVGNALRPGDIVLMHFRAEFAADLAAFQQAQLAAGLEVALLEDFLGAN